MDSYVVPSPGIRTMDTTDSAQTPSVPYTLMFSVRDYNNLSADDLDAGSYNTPSSYVPSDSDTPLSTPDTPLTPHLRRQRPNHFLFPGDSGFNPNMYPLSDEKISLRNNCSSKAKKTNFNGTKQRHSKAQTTCGQRAGKAPDGESERGLRSFASCDSIRGRGPETFKVRDFANGTELYWSFARTA